MPVSSFYCLFFLFFVFFCALTQLITQHFYAEEPPTGAATEAASPLLSKLFPQTSPDVDSTAEQERKKREEDEAKENERAWKRMKLG